MNADTPQPPTNAAPAPYRVLARKYRPIGFEDLIGQEPMVRTLSNAFALNRIHQAYILTGVRGVGKTTTARILARAFNYELPGRIDAPTIDMPEIGRHCQAIIESRHMDVIEMDAASNTGIDDVREIIANARYNPVIARTKVFIIDEVHMLSKAAFNGLLKTLEEPPDHVKFLFATTEIEKVPITVRSRCQRFDLRRVEAGELIAHLAKICAKENITIEADALALIARASEGSVRDSLSLLDQAIAHSAGAGPIRAEDLSVMLGLADRSRIIDLFEVLMRGEIAPALNILKDLHDKGADPMQVLTELAEFIHLVTRLKLVPQAADDASLTPEERQRGVAAGGLSIAVLTRAFQILLKGLEEMKDSPRPMASADMVLVRLAYAADLPTPDEALRRLAANPRAPSAPALSRSEPQASAPQASASPTMPRLATTSQTVARMEPRTEANAAAEPQLHLGSFAEIVAHAGTLRDIKLKMALERDIRLVRFEQGLIEFSLGPEGSPQLAQTLSTTLQKWTGQRWMVAVSSQQGAPSLREQADKAQRNQKESLESHPMIQAVMARFPGAKITDVRKPILEPAPQIETGNDEIAYIDENDDDS